MAIPPLNQSLFDERSQNQSSQQNDQLKKLVSAPTFIPSELAMVNVLSTNDTLSLSSGSNSNTPTPMSSTPSRASTPTIETTGQRYLPLLPIQYTSTTSFGHLDDRDAMYIFEGVRSGSLLKIERPLNEEECRNLVKPGAVFVFDEGPTFKSWIDGRIWSEVVQNGAFAFFRELLPQTSLNGALCETGFIKKCTSLYVPEERVFRHLVSYYHHDTLHLLPRPIFDPSLLLHPSYFGRLDSYSDAQILVDGVDYGILHRARRPPLSFEIDSLIMPGSIFVWDDAVPGSRWWGDGKLWQPSQIAGAMVVFREMDTAIMEDPSTPNGSSPTVSQTPTAGYHQHPAVAGPPRYQTSPQVCPPTQSQNTVMKIFPKLNGLIKKVMTLASNKSGRIYQIIAYVNDASIGLHQAPSMDRQLHEKIASVVGFFNGLGTGIGVPGIEVLVAPINQGVDNSSNSMAAPHPHSNSSTTPNGKEQEAIPPTLIETFLGMRVAVTSPANDLLTGVHSGNNINDANVSAPQDRESMNGKDIRIRLPDPQFERIPRYHQKRRTRTSTASTPTPFPDTTLSSSQKSSSATSNNGGVGLQKRPVATTRSLAAGNAFSGSRKANLTLTTSNLNRHSKRNQNGDGIGTPRSA